MKYLNLLSILTLLAPFISQANEMSQAELDATQATVEVSASPTGKEEAVATEDSLLPSDNFTEPYTTAFMKEPQAVVASQATKAKIEVVDIALAADFISLPSFYGGYLGKGIFGNPQGKRMIRDGLNRHYCESLMNYTLPEGFVVAYETKKTKDLQSLNPQFILEELTHLYPKWHFRDKPYEDFKTAASNFYSSLKTGLLVGFVSNSLHTSHYLAMSFPLASLWTSYENNFCWKEVCDSESENAYAVPLNNSGELVPHEVATHLWCPIEAPDMSQWSSTEGYQKAYNEMEMIIPDMFQDFPTLQERQDMLRDFLNRNR